MCILMLTSCKKEGSTNKAHPDTLVETSSESGEARADLDDFFKGKYAGQGAKQGTSVGEEQDTEEHSPTNITQEERADSETNPVQDTQTQNGMYFKRNYGMYGYRSVTMFGPCDINVVNSQGQSVYISKDGKAIDLENSEIQYGGDAETGQRVDLYGSDTYNISMLATQAGKMFFSVVEVYSGTGEPRRINTFADIDVVPGDLLRAEIPKYTEEDVKNIRYGSSQEYKIYKNDEMISSKNEIRGEDVNKNLCKVTIMEGTGDKFSEVDTRIVIKGSAIKLTPKMDTRTFLGWYVGANQISDSKDYIYLVKGDTEIKGVYQ